jgi:hypothetical protein
MKRLKIQWLLKWAKYLGFHPFPYWKSEPKKIYLIIDEGLFPERALDRFVCGKAPITP